MRDLVAIVIVNYNNYEDTLDCIKSLQEISYPKYKIYVVDNNSTNESLEKLKKAKLNIELISNTVNSGFAGGVNKGIKIAIKDKPKYFLLINNDTTVAIDFLEPLINIMEKNEKIGIVTGKILYEDTPHIINVAGGKIKKRSAKVILFGENTSDGEMYNIPKKITFASGCLQLIRDVIIEDVGLYDEDYFLYYEDADYCYRAVQKGYEIVYAPASKIYHKGSRSTGGKANPLVIYYNIRNRLRFHQSIKYNIIMKFIYTHIYIYARLAYSLLKGKTEYKVCKIAIKDYKKGIVGACNESIDDK